MNSTNTSGPVRPIGLQEVGAGHRGDGAEVGPAEEGDELRGEEHQHDVEPRVLMAPAMASITSRSDGIVPPARP
jgi:hypothetical protein